MNHFKKLPVDTVSIVHPKYLHNLYDNLIFPEKKKIIFDAA